MRDNPTVLINLNQPCNLKINISIGVSDVRQPPPQQPGLVLRSTSFIQYRTDELPRNWMTCLHLDWRTRLLGSSPGKRTRATHQQDSSLFRQWEKTSVNVGSCLRSAAADPDPASHPPFSIQQSQVSGESTVLSGNRGYRAATQSPQLLFHVLACTLLNLALTTRLKGWWTDDITNYS